MNRRGFIRGSAALLGLMGCRGRPLLSRVLKSVPGKDISKGMNWKQA